MAISTAEALKNAEEALLRILAIYDTAIRDLESDDRYGMASAKHDGVAREIVGVLRYDPDTKDQIRGLKAMFGKAARQAKKYGY